MNMVIEKRGDGMKGVDNKKWSIAAKTVSTTVAVQLALSASLLPALAEAESTTPSAISNTTLPMAQPAPSSMVKKIWGSLDVRKYSAAKKNQIASKKAEEKHAATAEAETKAEPAKTEVAEGWNGNDGSANGLERIKMNDEAATPSAPKNKVAAKPTVVTSPPPGAVKEQGSAPAITLDHVDTRDTLLNPDQTAVENKTASLTPSVVPNTAEEPKTSTITESTSTESKTEATDTAAAPSPTFNAGNLSIPSTTIKTETASTDAPITVASNLVTLPPGSVLGRVQSQNAPLVVDNDEAEEIEETLKYEEMPTDDGKTKAKIGARFPVVITSQISSKTAKKGEPIQARLKYDLKIGDRIVAKKGAVVNGHINYSLKARTILHSLVSKERWYRNSGCIGLAFDEIINDKGEHLPLSAQPSRQARIVKNKAEGRELGVNHYGQVTGPWAQQLRYKAVRIGLNFAMAPAGVFSFGAMPVALGVLGAANPSFAFSRPVGLNVRHRRLKGFAWGFLSGVPGSWLIEDTTVKGQEAIIKPGDEFYCELVQEFTGEPATDAQLMPGANTKLHGQVLTDPKKDKKKKK